MIKVIQVADDGTETVAIEVDDFTIEVVYSGIAEMLRQAAATSDSVAAPVPELHRRRAPATRAGAAARPRA